MIYQLFANELNTVSLILFLLTAPPVTILSIWLGRKAQKRYWLLNEPYETRLKAFVKARQA